MEYTAMVRIVTPKVEYVRRIVFADSINEAEGKILYGNYTEEFLSDHMLSSDATEEITSPIDFYTEDDTRDTHLPSESC